MTKRDTRSLDNGLTERARWQERWQERHPRGENELGGSGNRAAITGILGCFSGYMCFPLKPETLNPKLKAPFKGGKGIYVYVCFPKLRVPF